MSRILCTGAGGFIAGHLVDSLVDEGHEVVAVDIKPVEEWASINPEAACYGSQDLNEAERCDGMFEILAPNAYDEVYNLAANMGGMGYIETHKLECMDNVLINTHMAQAAHRHGAARYFFSGSACCYPDYLQDRTDVVALREEDAYPAMPEDGYGWEKLFSERYTMHYTQETDMVGRVARYHNVYGPRTAWTGGREKAPAAVSRKVAEAVISGDHQIEIWGDGEQVRSFMYVDDCVKGTQAIMRSNIDYPINLGSSESVTINQLVSVVEAIAGVRLERRYNLDAPKGVRGRNSDNTKIIYELGWEPDTSLVDGMERTYAWVYDRVMESA